MRILVAGSKRSLNDDQAKCDRFDAVARSIGAAIARTRHTLLVESDAPITFDYHAIQGAQDATPDSAELDIEVHRLLDHARVYSHLRVRQIPYHKPPDQLSDERLWARVGAVASSDVVIVLGGGTGTDTFASIAHDMRKPIVAIPLFEGPAKVEFDRQLPNYQLRPELQDLISTIHSPTHESGSDVVRFAEILSRKHGYFISYSHENKIEADHVELLLRREQRIVFRDEDAINFGEVWRKKVTDSIQRSETFVGLWSRAFKASEHCRAELEIAYNFNRQSRRPYRIHLILLDETPIDEPYTHILHAPGLDRCTREKSVWKILNQEVG